MHDSVRRRGLRLDRDGAVAVRRWRWRPRCDGVEAAFVNARRAPAALGSVCRADWRAGGDDLVDPGLPTGAGAGLVCDESRRSAAERVLEASPEVSDTGVCDVGGGGFGGDSTRGVSLW